jgi:predicted RNase H-like nuclease (RuvC/YqgF family)
MTLKMLLPMGLLLALGACASSPDYPALRNVHIGSDTAMMLNELERVATLSPEQRKRELAALEGERRIDNRLRFQAAALLEREDSVEAYERGLKNLSALDNVDVRTQPLVEQMKRLLKLRIELKQQTMRAQELQDKLDQIKALEKALQQRTAPASKP